MFFLEIMKYLEEQADMSTMTARTPPEVVFRAQWPLTECKLNDKKLQENTT